MNKGTKDVRDKQKTNSKMAKLNSNISVIVLNVIGLSNLPKRQRLSN